MRSHSSRRAKKLEPVELQIEKLSHEGRGIAHHEGRVVFVDQALPGETVRAKFTNMKGSFAEAATEEVLIASPERVEPPCAYFSACGGCSLQHMQSDNQLSFKASTVHEKLAHSIGSNDYRHLDVISSESSGYRRKARLGVRFVGKKDKVLVGFRERYSNFVVDMQSCVILDKQISILLSPLADLIKGMQSSRLIPQIEVAVGDPSAEHNSCALVFRHLQPLSDGDKKQLIDFGAQHVLDIYLQSKGPDTVHKIQASESADRLYYSLPDFDLEFAFHPMDFTQVNAAINRKMVNKAIELLDIQAEDKVLDLFCGLGNFTLAIARSAAQVTGVEGVDAMVERGQENAARNQIENTTFLCADLTRPPEEHAWLQQGFDKVLLDPPRSGALEVLPAVIAAKPKRIVYVSCNPATLARDAASLLEHGYRLESAGAMDMFPHTSHVEAIALFIPVK